MSEFIRKIKNRLRVFDIEHGRILSRYKIFITIMGLALSIVFVAAIAMGAMLIVRNNNDTPINAPTHFRTRWPEEDVMADAGVATTIPPAASVPPVTRTPLPPRTLQPIPSVTPTPDPIVDKIEKPEDVVVNDTVMKEDDKKDDGKNNADKNTGNVSNIKPENNDKYINGATQNTYTDNGFYVKDGLKYYAKNGVTISKVGIDVSIYQGDIDWKKVKSSGVDFVMIRLGFRGYATGKLMLDANFHKNIEGALDAGLDVGIYFFSQAVTTKEAVEEATMCIKYLAPYKGRITYPVAIDTEYVNSATARTNKSTVTNKIRTDVCIAFCETVKNAGYKPMVYSNKNWLLNNLQLSRLNNYDIWYARYGSSTPDYDYDFTIWQYTGSGRINGIVGDVDLNVALKDYSGKNGNKPVGSKEPEKTNEPVGSLEPQVSEVPQETLNPDNTPESGETNEPQGSVTPDGTNEPQDTNAPEVTPKPDDNDPQDTPEPTPSQAPEQTVSPSKEPEGSKEPEVTQAPTNTTEPEGSMEPVPSENPSENDGGEGVNS